MENKNVGYLILGISVLMILIIFLFNSTLRDFVTSSCSLAHGDLYSCPMYETISQQTYLSLGIVGLLIVVGFVLVFSKPHEKIVLKKIRERKRKMDLSNIDKDEKRVVDLLIGEDNAMFQADLMEKLGIGKVKMTRILDKLEAKQIIERKRRGMTNIVVLRE